MDVGNMRNLKDESGVALIYALFAIFIVSSLVGGIFFIALQLSSQIDKVDQLNRVKDVQEYALQDASVFIKKKFESDVLGKKTVNFGNDITILSDTVDVAFNGFTIPEKKGIGVDKRYSYKVEIEKIQKTEIDPYVVNSSSGSFGWLESNGSGTPKATNARVSFVLKATVEEDVNGTKTTRVATSDFVYEVQWERLDATATMVQMDVWRNIFYTYYLPSGVRYITADEWMRKMQRIYEYQEAPTAFSMANFNNAVPQTLGKVNGQVVDLADNTPLDFGVTGKRIQTTLDFDGSFLLTHGVKLRGSVDSSKLETKNMLALRNDQNLGHQLNYIQKLNVVANVGTYVNINGASSKFILDNQGLVNFHTSNLLINDTQDSSNKNTNNHGFLLSEGQINVTQTADAGNFSFANYATSAKTKNPQDMYWSEFLKGNMIIASSNVYAGPVTESSLSVSSKKEDVRKITVDGNFMLTNAKLSTTGGEEGFSYFGDEQTFRVPHAPSVLTLSGENTNFTVSNKGFSYIDAPKKSRRPSSQETSGPVDFTDEYYGNMTYWNSIVLKDQAHIDLGMAGFEPFHLKTEKDTQFTASLLPDLELFDPMFLIAAHNHKQLKGKVILKPFNQGDANKLLSQLKSEHLPVESVANESAAANGKISIVMPLNTSGKDAMEMISRTFDYTNNVKY